MSTNYDLERLFLLEILVDDVDFSDEIVKSHLRETCVSFKFLNHPQVFLCESDFPEIASEGHRIYFNSGKSCLFSMRGKLLTRSIDLDVNVYKKNERKENVFIGRTHVPLGGSFIRLFDTADGITEDPKCKTIRGVYAFTDDQDQVTGKIGVLVRLSCFGSLIVTQFEVKNPEEEFLFKSQPGSAISKGKTFSQPSKPNVTVNEPGQYQNLSVNDPNKFQMKNANFPGRYQNYPAREPSRLQSLPVREPSTFQYAASEPNMYQMPYDAQLYSAPTHRLCQPCNKPIRPTSQPFGNGCPCEGDRPGVGLQNSDYWFAPEQDYRPMHEPQLPEKPYRQPDQVYVIQEEKSPERFYGPEPTQFRTQYRRPESVSDSPNKQATVYNISEIREKPTKDAPIKLFRENSPSLWSQRRESKSSRKSLKKDKKARSQSMLGREETFDFPFDLRGPKPGDLMCWGGKSGDGPPPGVRAIWIAEEVKGEPGRLCWVGREATEKEVESVFRAQEGTKPKTWKAVQGATLPSVKQHEQKPLDLTSKIIIPRTQSQIDEQARRDMETEYCPCMVDPEDIYGRGDPGMNLYSLSNPMMFPPPYVCPIPFLPPPPPPPPPSMPYPQSLYQMSAGQLPTVSSMSFGGTSVHPESSESSSSESDDEKASKLLLSKINFCDCKIPLPPAFQKADKKKKKKKKGKGPPICAVTCGDPRCVLNKFTTSNYKCTPIATRGFSDAKLSFSSNQAVFNTSLSEKSSGPCPTYSIPSTPNSRPQLIQVAESGPNNDPKNDTFLLNVGKTDSSGKPAKLNLTFKTPKQDSPVCTSSTAVQCAPEAEIKIKKDKKKKKGSKRSKSKKSKRSKSKKGKKKK